MHYLLNIIKGGFRGDSDLSVRRCLKEMSSGNTPWKPQDLPCPATDKLQKAISL